MTQVTLTNSSNQPTFSDCVRPVVVSTVLSGMVFAVGAYALYTFNDEVFNTLFTTALAPNETPMFPPLKQIVLFSTASVVTRMTNLFQGSSERDKAWLIVFFASTVETFCITNYDISNLAFFGHLSRTFFTYSFMCLGVSSLMREPVVDKNRVVVEINQNELLRLSAQRE